MNSPKIDLGIGVGLRPAHYHQFLEQKPDSVSWIEVISENYMSWKDHGFNQRLDTLLQIRRDLPVALHGVAMNLGSASTLNFDYLEKLKALIEIVDPVIVSDHLAWTGLGKQITHDLLPLPYTQESLDLMIKKIDQVQFHLGRAIAIENPSTYLEFKSSDFTEAQFLKELTARTGCGLLLDINNVYVSSVNHGFNPMAYLETLPGNSIQQIHLAGHSVNDGFLIDTHDQPVCQEVWDLYEFSLRLFGPRSTMIERDDNIPEWQELERELLHIGDLRNEANQRAV